MSKEKVEVVKGNTESTGSTSGEGKAYCSYLSGQITHESPPSVPRFAKCVLEIE